MSIARDTFTSGGSVSPYNHTCTGDKLSLFVVVVINITSGSPPADASCTYDSVAMTLEETASHANGGEYHKVHLFSLIAPSTGLNAVAITNSDGTLVFSTAVSYTGVKQTDFPHVTASENDSAASPDIQFTTTKTSGAVAGIVSLPRTVTDAGAGSTELESTSGYGSFESSSLALATGLQAMVINCSANSANKSLVAVAFEAFVQEGQIISFDP